MDVFFGGFWRPWFFQGLQSYLTFHQNYSKIPGDSSRDLFGMVSSRDLLERLLVTSNDRGWKGNFESPELSSIFVRISEARWLSQAVPKLHPRSLGWSLNFTPSKRVTFFHHPKKVTAWITRLRAIFSELLKEVLFGPKKNSEKNCLASFGPGGSSHRKSHHGFTAVPKAGRSDHRISSPWEKSRRKKDLTKT